MGEYTEISWCHHTFNLAWGCTKVSPACEACYAEAWAKRHGVGWGPNATRRTFGAKYWDAPLKWDRDAAKAGERHRVFCSSMCDVFEDHPVIEREREVKLWNLIDATPNLDWLLLTKRPERMAEVIGKQDVVRPNVWAGTTVEDRKHGLPRMGILRSIPAVIRFVSAEPLLQHLGTIDLSGIAWLIAGGESKQGPDEARPMHIRWVRSLRDRCVAAGVSFHFKQWGHWSPIDQPWEQDSPKRLADNERWVNLEGGHGFHGEEVWRMRSVGKGRAGRMLDGRTWDEFPGSDVVPHAPEKVEVPIVRAPAPAFVQSTLFPTEGSPTP
jgi:protein gp37